MSPINDQRKAPAVRSDAWPDDVFAHAAKLWADGRSAAEIGREIGKSRNAVIGIASRNRDCFPEKKPDEMSAAYRRRSQTTSPETRRPTEKRRSRIPVVRRPIIEKPDVLSPVAVPDDAKVIVSGPVTFLHVSDRQCRWPLWGIEDNPGAEGLCCGASIDPGKIYCSHHRRRSTGPGTPSERYAPRLLAKEAM